MTTLKIISIFILAVSISLASAQEAAAASVNAPMVTSSANQAAPSSPQNTPSEAPSTLAIEDPQAKIEAAQAEGSPNSEQNPVAQPAAFHPELSEIKQEHSPGLQQKIDKAREEVVKSINLDKQYLKEKIQQVVGSMTAEQREAFELKMSAQARAAYEKYTKQTQLENQKEHEQIEKLKEQTTFSKSDAILNAETQQFEQSTKNFQSQNRSFTYFTFELPAETSQDFRFALPIQQEITVIAYAYASTDGVYSVVKDVEEDSPMWIYVYEDREKIVAQKSFYVRKVLTFIGKANSTYLIRCVNHGKSKLVTMHVTNVLLQSNIRDKLFVEDVADHAKRISTMKLELAERMGQTRDKMMFKELNQKKLLLGLDHYYFYNIVEIVVLGIICVIQVESVRKLLMNNSVI